MPSVQTISEGSFSPSSSSSSSSSGAPTPEAFANFNFGSPRKESVNKKFSHEEVADFPSQ